MRRCRSGGLAQRRRCLGWGAGVGLGLWGGLGTGSIALAASAATETASTLAQWLARIQDGAENRNYQGTLVFTAGAMVSSSRVAHYCDGAQRYERVEMLDGQVRQVLRHNDEVKVLWPRMRLAVIDHRDPVAAFPALGPTEAPATDVYELRVGAIERVAGHDAQVLKIRPRDNLRFAQSLWVEPTSGLLLRADTLGPRGEMLESAAFSDLTIGARPQPQAVLSAMKKLDGFRVLRPPVGRVQLAAEGWQLGPLVAGFVPVSCLRRTLDPTGSGEGEGQPVVQSVYADGLTHVSVFIERFDAGRHKPLRTLSGATHTVAQARGDWWITVVGEVPFETIDSFHTALKRRT